MTAPAGEQTTVAPVVAVGPWEQVVRTHYEVRDGDGIVITYSDFDVPKRKALEQARDWVWSMQRRNRRPYRIVERTQTWWSSADVWSEGTELEPEPCRHDLIGGQNPDGSIDGFCAIEGCDYTWNEPPPNDSQHDGGAARV